MPKPPLRPDPALKQRITGSHNTQVQTTLLHEIAASQAVHADLDASHANSARLEGQLIERVTAFGREVTAFLALVAARGTSQDRLVAATKQLREAQMSFNQQYLQLQIRIQNENQSYTAISNIMKTKHDTVKNSIGNIR